MVKKQHSFSPGKFIASMKFGMILLLLLAGYSTLGTLIPQERPLGFYEENYSELVFTLIRIFQLHKVYSSVYFIILTLFFSGNLIFCSLRRLPGTIRLYKKDLHIDSLLIKNPLFEIPVEGIKDSKALFHALGYRKFRTVEVDGKRIAYAVRRRWGYFGSYLVHLGILVVILALASGKLFGYETFLTGIPGDELAVTDTDYVIHLTDFDILYRADHSIHQYISSAEFKGRDNEVIESGDISVNSPMRTRGYKIYQSGTGWMMELVAKRGGEEILRERFYQSGAVMLEEQDLALEFRSFYPDFVLSEGKAYTKTPFLNRPKYLFILYEGGKSVYMNVASPGETIRYGDIEFQAFDPKLFTVLQVIRDPGAIFAALGGFFMLIGLLLTFYYVPGYIMAEEREGKLILSGGSYKNKEAYRLQMEDRLSRFLEKGGK
ncbi:cytochrome c biogenesis protein ResB [Proteiniclasticum sp.]|uniref:cytochrome c biogenesis protein ResB n=1 Tax=Proteiniclasticum sp. TaxID=2053595 RepID=UPI00289A745E|nr:cytochrome c biogenesis protein ResB [Proteiniclasticum sp.]